MKEHDSRDERIVILKLKHLRRHCYSIDRRTTSNVSFKRDSNCVKKM